MTIIRMLSPEALIRLVTGEDAHQDHTPRTAAAPANLLYVLPKGPAKGRGAKAAARNV